ncbi:MAG: Gfo/Idh/MocA family oxidoreductase, partial [Solirubrobacterales bacterium]|nr:Gfo/Idh/MocA family oxidoreductase [Solirubrobacterales bacterium]
RLSAAHGGAVFPSVEALLAEAPDVTVVATPHNLLAELSCAALAAGSHVLVEKPAGIGVADVTRIAAAAEAAGRLVKVGFNKRFHPAIARAVSEARSGEFGEIMFVRARYGHGGRLGYEREWRMRPELSGGGEMTDQGMHLLDLYHWLLGELPVHSALLRTQFWDAPVEDNAVLVLGEPGDRSAPWGTFHVSWTEWKNMFSLEIYCVRAKLVVDGLTGSYGDQQLTIFRMSEQLGPPAREDIAYPSGDVSWEGEWRHFTAAIRSSAANADLLGGLDSAAYAWRCIERAQALNGYRAGTEEENLTQ